MEEPAPQAAILAPRLPPNRAPGLDSATALLPFSKPGERLGPASQQPPLGFGPAPRKQARPRIRSRLLGSGFTGTLPAAQSRPCNGGLVHTCCSAGSHAQACQRAFQRRMWRFACPPALAPADRLWPAPGFWLIHHPEARPCSLAATPSCRTSGALCVFPVAGSRPACFQVCSQQQEAIFAYDSRVCRFISALHGIMQVQASHPLLATAHGTPLVCTWPGTLHSGWVSTSGKRAMIFHEFCSRTRQSV